LLKKEPSVTPTITSSASVMSSIPSGAYHAKPALSLVREVHADYQVASDGVQSEVVEDFGIPSAVNVHNRLKSLHKLGNDARLRFIEALREMNDGNLFCELGYSNLAQYCETEFGLAKSSAFEYVRVAIALDALPSVRGLYSEGELSWHQVRSITRVATAATEAQWIAAAFDMSSRELHAEVTEAWRTGRDAPREKRHGLPNLMMPVTFNLTMEEKQRVRAAFQCVDEALGDLADNGMGSDDHAVGDTRPALVRWADLVLAGVIPAGPDPAARNRTGSRGKRAGEKKRGGQQARGKGAGGNSAGVPGTRGSGDPDTGGNADPDTGGSGDPDTGRSADPDTPPASERGQRRTPAQTIVYHSCRECSAATVATADGLVEVTPERIAELAPDSNVISIAPGEELVAASLPAGEVDKPNSSGVTRRVLHRDGMCCANPRCGSRRKLHAHHIVYRARGGATRLRNLVTVCERCHSLLHVGLLDVTGSPFTGLVWRRRPLSSGAKLRDVNAVMARAKELAAQCAHSTVVEDLTFLTEPTGAPATGDPTSDGVGAINGAGSKHVVERTECVAGWG
jgi:hypothetical protein